MGEKSTAFSEFAQALAVYRQGNQTPAEYTRSLFMNIHGGSYKGTSIVVSDAEDRTLKGYFYAEHDITTMAKQITDDLDIGQFANFITVPGDDSAHSLVIVFREWCPEITDDTYGIEIAERFQNIIQEAATTKRKKKKPQEQQLLPAVASGDYRERYGISLVAEVRSTCPGDGCTKTLFTRSGGQIASNYEVVVIDSNKPVQGEKNLIAMCPDCAKKYNMNRSLEAVERMRAIKSRFEELAEIQDLASEQKLDEDVSKVLEKIPYLPHPMQVDLNYTPAAISSKIPNNPELMARVKVWVNLHYPDVHETLQLLNKTGKLKFEPFCMQVRLNYLKLFNEGYSQNQIYDGMIQWLVDATNESYHACEIVIAYFVQKCEVFDVIA